MVWPVMNRRIRPRVVLDTVATIGMLIASIAIVYSLSARNAAPSNGAAEVIPTTPLDLDHAELKGSRSADVVLLIFSDFQCPFCARFARTTLPRLVRGYVDTGKVLLAYRHLPLEQLHPQALGAGAAAACASMQGLFWPMHDALFEDQANLDPASIVLRARSVGLELASFEACVDTIGVDLVRADVTIAREIGIESTPYVLVGRRDSHGRLVVSRSLRGARPLEEFTTAIDALLSR